MKVSTLADVKMISDFFWSRKFYNVDVLLRPKKKLELMTFFPFSVGKCGKPVVELINYFDTATRKFTNDSFYPNKFKNLHRCQLIFAAIQSFMVKKVEGEVRAAENEIVDTLEEILNFSQKTIYLESIGKVYGNGSGSGAMKELFANKIQALSASLQFDRTQVVTESLFIIIDPMVLIIPPGAPFSPFEILYLTFDDYVWASIVLAFVVKVLWVKLLSKIFKNALTDDAQRNFSLLNTFNSFLGGSLLTEHLPNAYFSRLAFTSFMLYALIIRTAYTGVLFDYISSDVTHREVTNVDEMIAKDFRFYAYDSLLTRLVDFNFYDR